MKIPLYKLTLSDRDQLREIAELQAAALKQLVRLRAQEQAIYAKALVKTIPFDGIDPDDALEVRRVAELRL